MFQEVWFGRGKWKLKKVHESLFDLKCHWGTLPNKRDGMSVMVFSIPLMCCGISRQQHSFLRQRASAATKFTVTIEWHDARQVTQLMVGVLLLNRAMFASVKLHTISSMTIWSLILPFQYQSLWSSRSDCCRILRCQWCPLAIEVKPLLRGTHYFLPLLLLQSQTTKHHRCRCNLATLAPVPCIWWAALVIHGGGSYTGLEPACGPYFVVDIPCLVVFVVLHCTVIAVPVLPAELWMRVVFLQGLIQILWTVCHWHCICLFISSCEV